jgi:hypothetical protein
MDHRAVLQDRPARPDEGPSGQHTALLAIQIGGTAIALSCIY